MVFAFESSRVLTADGTIPASIVVDGGDIVSLGDHARSGMRRIDAGDHLLLPGIVDIHGDAFERQIMPRPGVIFPLPIAFADTDAQLLSAGITTAFHGITYSWEPGLRGAEMSRRILKALNDLRPRLKSDTRIHLRFETHNLDAADEIAGWIESGLIDLLGFNDHIPLYQERVNENPERLAATAKRAGMELDDFVALITRTVERGDEVPGAVRRLAAAAWDQGVPMLSHDDETPGMRQWYHDLGCRISEFPIDRDTAEAALDLDDEVVLGAPNILRGGSHCGRLSTREAIKGGYCSILASDYYYPSLLHSVFHLVREDVLSLADAWRMVSEAPAWAAGLTDRGTIAEGQRADLIVVDDSNPEVPAVRAVCVNGKFVHAAGDFAADNGLVSCAA
ncbi:MAG: alpha-D-ribose 1-methylphosphonate 5-triphosphate diphosphatase [Rhodospirillales bacterium]|nr:alpha-D-ribose 1-methylphosphonate 5-triphosphate diphosphatase [Rhodospirillales bacterium]